MLTTRPQLTLALAEAAVDAAVRRAQADGVAIAVAVVDAGARLVAFSRQDRAPIIAIRLAIEKAVTAAEVGLSTGDLWDLVDRETVLRVGLGAHSGILAIGGGIPLRAGDTLVGAIGVSGGHHSEDLVVAVDGAAEAQRLIAAASPGT